MGFVWREKMKKPSLLVVVLLFAISTMAVGAVYVARFYLVAPAQIEVIGSSYEIGLFSDAELSVPFSGVIAFDSLMIGDLKMNSTFSVSEILFIGLVNPSYLSDVEVVYVKWIGDIDNELPSSLVLSCERWNTGGWVSYAEDSYEMNLTKATPSKGIKFRIDNSGTSEGNYNFQVKIEAAEDTV